MVKENSAVRYIYAFSESILRTEKEMDEDYEVEHNFRRSRWYDGIVEFYRIGMGYKN